MNRLTIYACWAAIAMLSLPHSVLQACGYNYVSLCASTMNIEVDGNSSGYQISNCSYLTPFHNHDFGTVTSLNFTNMKSTTWESCNNEVLNAKFHYRIYEQSASPGSFTAVGMPQLTTITSGNYRTKTYEGLPNLNILLGLNPGDYFVEIYLESEISFNQGSGSVNDIITKNNGGDYYKAAFSISAGTPGSLSVLLTQQTNVSCPGNSNGSATVAASGGTPPYSYEWSNGATGATITGIGAGNYTVTATDDDDNSGTFTVVISQPSPINPNVTSVNETSASANNGSASAAPTGGTPPYSYIWSNGETAQAISWLDSGTYTVTVSGTGGCFGTSSFTIIVSGNAPANYCQSKGEFPWVDWITHVGLNTIDHTSGKSQYSNFTNLATELSTGLSYSISLENSYSWQTYNEYWKVWIDYNRNGIFEEPQETAFEGFVTAPALGTQSATTTGTFNVPVSAEEGTTRMRVALKRDGYATPCETIPFGEVEDYTINIANGGPVVCSISSSISNPTCNNNGTNADPADDVFSFSLLVNGNGTSANWTTTINGQLLEGPYGVPQVISALPISLGQIDFDIYDGGDSTCLTNQSVTPPPTCSTPDPCSITPSVSAFTCDDAGTPADPADDTFTFNLTANGTNAGTGWTATVYGQTINGTYGIATQIGPIEIALGSQTVSIEDTSDPNCNNAISIQPPLPCSNGGGNGTYCQSESAFPWHDWIAGVLFEEIDNASGKSPYGNFTSLTANATAGDSYDIELTSGFSWFTYDEYWKVWIDYNQNGSFEEPAELAFSASVPAPANGTLGYTTMGAITIDNAALIGPTRMRVAMKRDAAPTPCETLPYGEVEDYTINIVPSSQALILDLAGTPALDDIDLFAMIGGKSGDGWLLEKSTDNIVFEIIGAGELTDEAAVLIETKDDQPEEGNNYYRIKLLDENGQLLSMRSTAIPFQHVALFDVFPNPATTTFNLKLTEMMGKEVGIEIYNRLGQPMYRKVIPEVSEHIHTILIANWPEGLYQVIIHPEGRRMASRQVVVMSSN